MEEFPAKFGFSVSHTTRSIRPSEVNGVHYHFVDRAAMEDLIAKDEFVEHAEFSGNMYGTSKKALQDVSTKGLVPLLDIDMQGVISIMKANLDPKPKFIFIRPPSTQIVRLPSSSFFFFTSSSFLTFIFTFFFFLFSPCFRVCVFVFRGNAEKLLDRLRGRGDTSEEAIAKRFKQATWEIETADTLPIDTFIVNDDFDAAYSAFKQSVLEANI